MTSDMPLGGLPPAVLPPAVATLGRLRTIESLRGVVRAVEVQDVDTAGHSDRVADLAVILAQELDWSKRDQALLHEAGLLHDVGKVAVPTAILLKPGRLTPEEYAVVKRHAALGAQIVGGALSRQQAGWVRAHHERWDGRGYPDGLAGEAIPTAAALLGLADAWDAMTHRTHSGRRNLDSALDECLREAGRQFAPRAVGALVRVERWGGLLAA